jgi:hypothetical protein
VVATDRALFVDARRLAWADVAHAEWDDDRALLSVQPMRREDGVLRVRLPSPERVPETVRERVTASVVLSRHVPVRGGAGVRVIARQSAASGELGWQVAVDAPLDPDDPQVRAVAEAALAELRRELGA